ncbi:hypothetical protein FFWV33_11575 [Flavobacterium faecale]|uniref:Uncharacterized protein n=2 Tax=Flavobacterium faecale TaxID=1355330 RepID=A0A2S1LEC5_9FLAO|nr:hypothetical protein FFWV33_11575 [Flavobacterium faecale]
MIITLTSYAQTTNTNNLTISKIDSIAKSKNITVATINYRSLTMFNDRQILDNSTLVKKQKFYFDGPFLVLDNYYFAIDKMFYFLIKDDYIEFYFQVQ